MTTAARQEYHRRYYERNRERIKQRIKDRYHADLEKARRSSRDRGFKFRYGVSLEERDALVAKGCEVCGQKEGKICLDHDHGTGQLRGVLCHGCNVLLGYAAEDAARLRAAAEYIEGHQ